MTRRARLAVLVLGRCYRAVLLTLLVAATAPALWGWSPSWVASGSMTPAIAAGDVVVAAPLGDREVRAGQVVVFDRGSARSEELVVHRVRAVAPDGTLTTRGDANETEDAAPVHPDRVRGLGVVLVPYVGLPLHWSATRAWLPLLGWGLATVLLFHLAADRSRRPRLRLRAAPVAATTALLTAVVVLPVQTGSPADASFTARTQSRGSTWQAAHPYTWAVRADRPAVYYPVDETGGTVARDLGGYAMHGTYAAIAAYGQPGATPRSPGTSVRIDGRGGRVVAGGAATTIPTTFSIELWFKTSSTTGGKVVGFESTRDAVSPKYDRHVFMRPDGRLVYGAWKVASEPTILLTSPAAYNDGTWHHLVVTGYYTTTHRADIFVDGALVASGPVTSPSDYYGWWRAGYGGLPTGPDYPASADFHGYLDNMAGYTVRLSAARVKAHYDAR